jgi:RNA polymerase sigma factor (TIGR02999 family)
MAQPSPHEVTQLLLDWSNGDQLALDRLMPLVHAELRRLAHHYMGREHQGHTLQTTALVNEAYLRLVGQKEVRWQNRAQFFGLAAQLMRHILVDHARSHHYAKRGGGAQRVPLEEAAVLSPERGAELVALDEAMKKLETDYPRQCRVVELRYFGGLTVEETAEVMKMSSETVMRDWKVAKARLRREMSHGAGA